MSQPAHDPFGNLSAPDPFGGEPEQDLSDDQAAPDPFGSQPAHDNAGERTVVASADVLAAALAQAEAQAEARAATATAFVPTVPPVQTVPPHATAVDWAVEAAIEALPPAHAAAPAVPSFGNGPPGGLIGYQLNDLFEIVRFIARGGMGEVYEGRNIASGERVAIKVILPQFAVDEQFMALFRREASALERLGHDALVKYRTLAFDRTSQLNYLAIEFVDGVPMSDNLDGTPADAATVRIVLRRLAAGLGAAHIAGVIHRDLSPDNILLPNGDVARAKIIDFGIAKDTNPGEKSVVGDAFAGKFGYAAPEIFGKYKRSVGPWTDVYSLALTVLALAKGKPLDMGITIVDALEARDTVPDLSFLEPDLVRVFTGMLQPDPEVRFRSMEAVIEALDAPAVALVGDQLRTAFGAPAGPLPASPAFVRADAPTAAAPLKAKSKAPLFGGIAGVVLLLAGAGGYFALNSSPKAPATTDLAAPPVESASTDAANPTAAVAATKVDWSAARPQLLSALAAVPCSDLRIGAAPGDDGGVQITGWRAGGTILPTAPAGYRLNASEVAVVATPSGPTCTALRQLRTVIPAGNEDGFSLAGEQNIAYSSLPATGNNLVSVDLHAGSPPAAMSKLLIANLDDRPGSGEKQIESGNVGRDDLAGLTFERKDKRYLVVLIAGAKAPPAPTSPLKTEALAQACAGGGCTMVSGWLDFKP